MALLLQGTPEMHELLHCYEFTNALSFIQMSWVCVQCFPQQRGDAERMLHQRCGQDYLKNLLKPIFPFFIIIIISAHSAPHFDALSIVRRDWTEAITVWSISLFSVLSLPIWFLLSFMY